MGTENLKKKKTVKEISVERGEYMQHERKLPKLTNEIKKIAHSFKKHNESNELQIFVAGGARAGNDPIYEQESFLLGEKIAQMNFRLFFGLAGVGIMGAVAKGVLKVWASQADHKDIPIKGFTTKRYMSFTQADDVINQIKDVLVAHTLEERKNELLNADFVVFAPGGLGTLDELAYDCVAMQDGFLPMKPLIIFNVNGYYHHILEFLKEIVLKGFARPVPFIVADDAFEAGIAFEVLKEAYRIPPAKEEVLPLVEKVIYEMPFILQEKQANPNRPVEDILAEIEEKKDDEAFSADVEKAYLHKEIDRMYVRLERTGHDTALVSEKLMDLKERRKKELDTNGLH